jgi:hypothetical protein
VPNPRSQYPIAYPHSNGPTILGDLPAGSDQNSAPAPDYMAHSSDDERRDDGYVAPYLDPFHSGPTTSIHGGTFITAGNVNFYGKKRRREGTIDGGSFSICRRATFCLPDLTVQMVRQQNG